MPLDQDDDWKSKLIYNVVRNILLTIVIIGIAIVVINSLI